MSNRAIPARHALILAAGRGSRLQPDEGHKLLVSIEGKTLLDRHLSRFQTWGVDDVTVVTGYRHRELESELERWSTPEGLEMHTAVNPDFDASNGLSVLAGIRAARRNEAIPSASPFWLTMSDHLFEPRITEVVRTSFPSDTDSIDALLAVDRKIESIFDLPDANKIRWTSPRDARSKIEAIGKAIDAYHGIDTGLFWCDREFVEALHSECEARGDATTSDALRRLADRRACHFLEIGDILWQDIDTPEARSYAEQLIQQGWNRHDEH